MDMIAIHSLDKLQPSIIWTTAMYVNNCPAN